MGKKIRTGIVTVLAAIFALAVVIAPKTALAADTIWSYSDEDSGASVSFYERPGAVGERDLTVTVLVDGVEKTTETLKGIHTTLGVLSVNAPEGYDVYVEQNGTHLVGIDSFNVAPTAKELTVSMAKSVKANNFPVADDTTEYGTFSWSDPYATNSAFPRHLTVKVDGKTVAETTVTTPALLTNETDTPRYWFTPNANKFKTSDVTITPSNSLNNTTNRDITVELVSLCGCGRDTCLCDGGCDCPVDCTCDDCMGATLGENQINTGYGILSYAPFGSEDEGTGYNLTVKIYVNGMIAWDGLSEQPLRIKGAGDGDGNYLNNLGFEEAQGYYYYAYENSYDLDTYGNAASTWDKNQSRLEFGDERNVSRNYHNVLNIYLWTFANSVDLNVDRGVAVGDEVWNYTISYDLPDPKTGEMRTWTYNATSFDATQTQIIPKNVPVTLTGVCEPGKEVELWHCEDARETSLRGITFTDPSGNNSKGGTEVEGPSAVLTVNSPSTTEVLVRIEAFNWAKAPTPEEIEDILGESAVTVDCVSP